MSEIQNNIFLSVHKNIDTARKNQGSDLIITIFEWQNFSSTLFGYGKEIINFINTEIEKLLKVHFNCLYHEYLFNNQIIILSNGQNMNNHQKHIDAFLKQCLKVGALAKPTPIYISFKAGISPLGNSITKCIDNAQVALFESKKSPLHNYVLHESNLAILTDEYHQMQLAAYIYEAIENNRLQLAYQPVIKASTGKVESYEALLRILTHEKRIISAGPFIPAAENFGFVNLIDDYVLCSIVKELKLDSKVRIAMNVSNITIDDEKWYKKAKSLLTPKLSKRLTIEITETSGGNNVERIAEFANKIKLLGCNVAIDDFGAGYTSFKQLKLIRVDVLKIDGIFVRDIIDNPKSVIFINTLLNLAKAYKLKTVAEFVESAEIAKVLIDLGVDYLQGFYYNQALNYRPWIKGDKII